MRALTMDELKFVSGGFEEMDLEVFDFDGFDFSGFGIDDFDLSYDNGLNGGAGMTKVKPKTRFPKPRSKKRVSKPAEDFKKHLNICEKLPLGYGRELCIAGGIVGNSQGAFEWFLNQEDESQAKWRGYLTPHFQ